MGSLKNHRHEMFCQHIVAGYLQGESARRAGYAEAGSDTQGCTLMKKEKIRYRIEELRAERLSNVKFEAKEVLLEHIDILHMDVRDIMNDDFTLKPLSTWPSVWGRYLTGIEVKELFESEKKGKVTFIGTLTKIKWPDKLKNLELLGKHIDVGAYKELTGHDVSNDTLRDFLNEISGQSLGPPSLRDKM